MSKISESATQEVDSGGSTDSGSSDAFLSLKRRVEVTRGVRFAAARRFERRHIRAYYIISMMSLFVIVLSVLPNVVEVSESTSRSLK